jgi:ATP-binding cassette subfamily C (CFTR/MRP) protein 1
MCVCVTACSALTLFFCKDDAELCCCFVLFVLCLSVATASVDVASDARIQSRLRELCAHSTLITIAHRLETVVDADRVLVLQEGKVVECDSPAALLAKPPGHSLLASMVDETGPANAALLRRRAVANAYPAPAP